MKVLLSLRHLKKEPYLTIWFGDTGQVIIDYVVPISGLAQLRRLDK